MESTLRNLPPLKSLHAFEAVARWLSLPRAADNLFVTSAAITRRVKQLETYLGIPLPHRLTRSVILTDEAKVVPPLLTEGFDIPAEAVDRLKLDAQLDILTVSKGPTFALK